MNHDPDPPTRGHFHHPKNLSSGLGRILWAPATTSTSGQYLPEGYALPGGGRTQDPVVARKVAEQIDAITRGVV